MAAKINLVWMKRTSITGGKAYEKLLYDVLAKTSNIKLIEINTENTDRSKMQKKGPKFLYNIYRIPTRIKFFLKILNFKMDIDSNLYLKDFFTVALSNNNKNCKNIALIHHIDRTVLQHKLIYYFLEKLFYKNIRNLDIVITNSKYWKRHFIERGCKDVRVIYNPFDIKNFNINRKDILPFKRKYNLTKPIIYLGNCQRSKGVIEAYNSLRDLDVHFITSGKREIDLPVLNLNLNYKEYLKLLSASDIAITMSKFNEGWCRTAHEAMLCKTPVIGSGRGGMGELLEGGKQIICRDFKFLRPIVLRLLKDKKLREEIGKNGYNYAKKFTLKRFEREWTKIIKEIKNGTT